MSTVVRKRSRKFDFFCTLFSDNNECTDGTNNCHANAACTNTDGSFTCACNTGYSGNGVTCTGRQRMLTAIGNGSFLWLLSFRDILVEHVYLFLNS